MTTLASVSNTSAAPIFGQAQVQRSALVRRQPDADGDDDAPKPERSEGPGRRNPLVSAMLSALSTLVPASGGAPSGGTPTATSPTGATATPAATPAATPTATPSTTTPAATGSTATSSDPAATLREAAYAFAHALYSALRGGGGGDDDGETKVHHHHHGHRGGDYGDLAERLTALANKLEAGSASTPPATTTTPPSPPSAPATVPPAATAPAPAPAPVPAPAPAPEPGKAGTGTINITININIGNAPATSPAAPQAAEPTSSPLVDAFKKLLTALGADKTSTASPTERLTAFLRTMADSLSSDKSQAPTTPTSGSLLNVSA